MGVPTSEVGYTIATTRRETTKVHKNMWWHWRKKKLRNKLSWRGKHLKAGSRVAEERIVCHLAPMK